MLPTTHPLRVSRIIGLPEWHPEHATFQPFDVFAFVVAHPDGVILVDTGVGIGNTQVDAHYEHTTVSIVDGLHKLHIDERDVQLIINSHLHFDHCGQNHAFDAPICAQRDEVDAARAEFYTVAEWATIPSERSRIVDGDSMIAPGVRVLHTPGHTPGHQAVIVHDGDNSHGTIIIAAQCIFNASEWNGAVNAKNLHAPDWHDAAVDSLRRLRSLKPATVYLSHDAPLSLLP